MCVTAFLALAGGVASGAGGRKYDSWRYWVGKFPVFLGVLLAELNFENCVQYVNWKKRKRMKSDGLQDRISWKAAAAVWMKNYVKKIWNFPI